LTNHRAARFFKEKKKAMNLRRGLLLFIFVIISSLPVIALEPRPAYTNKKPRERRLGEQKSPNKEDTTKLQKPPKVSLPQEPKQRPKRKEGSPTSIEDRLIGELNLLMGIRYHYGDRGQNGFDCSGLVSKIYEILFGLKLPRSAREMWKVGEPINKDELIPGDLVFFSTSKGNINHIGISIGKDKFVHASRSKGIIVSSLNEEYYARRYIGARRLQLKLKE